MPNDELARRLGQLFAACTLTQDQIAREATRLLNRRAAQAAPPGRPLPEVSISSNRISAWKRGTNVPARLDHLLAVVDVALPHVPSGHGEHSALFKQQNWKAWHREARPRSADAPDAPPDDVPGRQRSVDARPVAVEWRPGRPPAETTSFIGRTKERGEIEELLARHRLVTLVGPGGVGKTRLAIRAASELDASFEHGVCFVRLSGLRDPALLPEVIGKALGLPDDTLDALARHLDGRRLLLVLDTCEHVVDACAMLAEVLLETAPGLRILATSRRPLDITAEHTFLVAPLADPSDAMKLFADRAAAVAPGWRITDDNADEVARLCGRLDGLPLAIELAAAQLRALSAGQLMERLGPRMLALRASRGAGARHQTLRAAIDWSYELCSPAERLLWPRLSVFEAEFELADAEVVCADARLPAEEIWEVLSGLVAQSIVFQADDRYRMLGTLRDYGADQLERRGGTEFVRARAFALFSGGVRAAAAGLGAHAQAAWSRWFDRRRADMRATMEYGLLTAADEEAIGMLLGFARFLLVAGMIGEARHWAERFIATRDVSGMSTRDATEAMALTGLLAVLQDDLDAGRAHLRQAEERARADGDDISGLAFVRQAQGIAAHRADRADDAIALLTEAGDLHRRAGTTDVLVPVVDLFLAATHVQAGRTGQARRHAAGVIRVTTAAGELWCRSYAQIVLAMILTLDGDPRRGLDELRAGLRVKRDLGDRLGIALALDVAGLALGLLGDPAATARMSGAADAAMGGAGATLFGPRHHTLRALHIQQAQDLLGKDAFDEAYSSGANLPLDDAIARALDEGAERTRSAR